MEMAAQTMAEKRIGSLLVIEADEMVGIVTETDVVRKGMAFHLPASSTRVGAVMNYPLIQIDINRTVRHASRLMAKKQIRHLGVTEDNKVVGLLSVRDLVKMVSGGTSPDSFAIHNAAHLVHRSIVWLKARFQGKPMRDPASPTG
jgi:signal-transduction protein with cAMP-binding, CBS, and nucleotidyltransferase domain